MTYLFLAVPPYSGSTVLHNYIAKCSNVVPLTNDMMQKQGVNETGIVEGNAATSARSLYGDAGIANIRTIPGASIQFIQTPTFYDWNGIKTALDANWEQNNPNAPIRLQKTPNDTYRVQMMQPVFNAKWIIMVRDPFAWVQSTIEKLLARRINPSSMAEDIVAHVINTYDIQKQNQAFLGSNAYTMTFEDFVANTDTHISNLKNWMPELSDLTFTGACQVKHETVNGLVNNNDARIAAFKTISGGVDKFNALFEPHKEYIEAWGYKASL